MLLKKFQPVDFGLKVVGVGSVGTRCWILLLEGRDRNDPLFLQMKEATDSVLAEHLRPSPYEKSWSPRRRGSTPDADGPNDIFLGWTHTPRRDTISTGGSSETGRARWTLIAWTPSI